MTRFKLEAFYANFSCEITITRCNLCHTHAITNKHLTNNWPLKETGKIIRIYISHSWYHSCLMQIDRTTTRLKRINIKKHKRGKHD